MPEANARILKYQNTHGLPLESDDRCNKREQNVGILDKINQKKKRSNIATKMKRRN